MIDIRKANEKDTKVLALLGRITYTESHGIYIRNDEDLKKYNEETFSVSTIERALRDENNLFYIMHLNELPIGYAKLILNANHESLSSNNNCRLDKIYLLNDYIKLKLGQQLLDFICSEALQIGVNTIWLVVYYKNQHAIQFYLKNQFEEVTEIDFFVNGEKYRNLIIQKTLR